MPSSSRKSSCRRRTSAWLMYDWMTVSIWPLLVSPGEPVFCFLRLSKSQDICTIGSWSHVEKSVTLRNIRSIWSTFKQWWAAPAAKLHSSWIWYWWLLGVQKSSQHSGFGMKESGEKMGRVLNTLPYPTTRLRGRVPRVPGEKHKKNIMILLKHHYETTSREIVKFQLWVVLLYPECNKFS